MSRSSDGRMDRLATHRPATTASQSTSLSIPTRVSPACTTRHQFGPLCGWLVTASSLLFQLVVAEPVDGQTHCSTLSAYATCIRAVVSVTAQADGNGPPTTLTIEPDNTPLGNRVPLLLIHGIDLEGQPASPSRRAFDNLLAYLALTRQSSFFGRFKPYVVEWYSNRQGVTVSQLGRELRDALDTYDADPQFDSANVVIVAHSTGGLIARSFMQEWRLQAGPVAAH